MKTVQFFLTTMGMVAAGCAAEYSVENPERARRAVESPVERNSAHGEMVQLARAEGMPLVEVGLPNTRDQEPTVRTVVDNITNPLPVTPPTVITPSRPAGITVGGAATLPTTRPTTQPTTRPEEPRGVRVDPLIGPE